MGRPSNKRMSLAVANSVIMAPIEDGGERRGVIKEFLYSHIKTIVTLFMIFGTIAVIVVIVMVHKWRFESQQAAHDKACLDVAIIGGGLSGTYAAWRLKDSDLKVHVFEMSDRIGGRFYTHRFDDGIPEVNAELGAMYYIPQQHPLLNSTIHALKLATREFRPQNPDHATFYLRGVHLRPSQLNTTSIPYWLSKDEQLKGPRHLKSMYMSRVVTNMSDVRRDPLGATTREGIHLYKHGYWNILGRVATREGYNFLFDTAPYRSLLSNENAALLGSVDGGDETEFMTVAEGMDTIPVQMLEEFLNKTGPIIPDPELPKLPGMPKERHRLHMERRLACIQRKDRNYNLIFVVTKRSRTGEMKDTYEKENICARNVVLAIPRKMLHTIKWLPVTQEERVRRHIDSVEDVPALRVIFTYNTTWWRRSHPDIRHVTTDLPIRQAMFLGSQNVISSDGVSVRKRHVFMVANPDAGDTSYFVDLAESRGNCTIRDNIIADISKQLAKAFKVNVKRMPLPESIIVQDWSKDGGWHIWKKGKHWGKERRHLIQPLRQDRVYVVGSAYCGGACQLWAEGALKTVDELLRKYLDVR